jgi:hypothetical protein
MKTHKVWAVGVVLAGILMLQAAPRAVAQDQVPEPPQPAQDEAPAQDPPGRVAQLDYSIGTISFQPGGQGDWVQAVTNRPLTTGDNLWADKDSRAELHIGSAAIRMDSETSVTFLDLDDHTTQIKLSMGSVVVRVRHLDDGDLVEVDTPNVAFNIQRTGEYRFDVNADGTETDTTVRQGRGEATGGGDSYLVVGGQKARFTGTDQLDHEIDQIPAADDFDAWSSNRDQDEDRSEADNYVSEEMTGYEDLDGHGSWSNVAGYGPCWTPAAVAVDWAPYRYGHWIWLAPWGWTWVDDEPWGFAPFHYGRWAFVESRWYWVPGRVIVRPVYAPALVAFVGGGGFHLALSVGGPGVGWFPLAPGEVYMPWYRTSRGYVNNVNITNTRVNITQVTNVYNVYNSRTTNVTRITYINQRANAVTAVPRDAFVNARPVGRSFVRVDDRQIADAHVTYRPEEQPGRASVMGTGSPARVMPPAAVMNRPAIATRVPMYSRTPIEQSRPAVNIRETPGTPQAGPMRNETVPQPGTRYEAQRPTAPQPEVNIRPAQPQTMERPEAPVRTGERPVPRPSGPQSMEIPAPNPPLVRPAPAVQERPALQQSEQRKFTDWQQQRQERAQPASHAEPVHNAPPPAREAAPRPQERPAPDRGSDHPRK